MTQVPEAWAAADTAEWLAPSSRRASRRAGDRRDAVVLLPGPLYHNMPFSTSSSCLFHGNHVVLLPEFDAAAALRAIDRHRADVVWLVPTMMRRMWRILEAQPTAFDLGPLRAL